MCVYVCVCERECVCMTLCNFKHRPFTPIFRSKYKRHDISVSNARFKFKKKSDCKHKSKHVGAFLDKFTSRMCKICPKVCRHLITTPICGSLLKKNCPEIHCMILVVILQFHVIRATRYRAPARLDVLSLEW